MSTVWNGVLRDQIVERRGRLQAAIAAAPEQRQLANLLQEVDSALARIDADTYGVCESCHGTVERARLMNDPLARFCLECLSETEKRALEDDLGLAARIQSGLLPKAGVFGNWEVVYHYAPASVVSGDYCDLIAHENGAAGLDFLVGDVSGKGVAAAMLMAHMQAMFRSLIAVGMPLDRLVARANRLFVESTISTHFATLVCGRASRPGEIEICNAGHCPPLVVHDGEVAEVQATGLPIGIFAQAEFTSRRIYLAPGDSLVLYTDGLSEAQDISRAQYGPERLAGVLRCCRHLAAHELIDACVEDVGRFRSGAPLTDDLTVMVVRRV